MRTDHLTPFAILIGSLLIAAAIYFRPGPGSRQALYGDGYVYVVDLKKAQIANIIPGKTAK